MKSPRSVWTILREDTELVLPIFRLLKRRMRRPTDAKEGDFYIAQAPLWVNIVALTPEREVILVEQYRHGVHAVTVEVPGGVAGPVTERRSRTWTPSKTSGC